MLKYYKMFVGDLYYLYNIISTNQFDNHASVKIVHLENIGKYLIKININ